MKIDSITIKGSAKNNEDSYVINEELQLFAVVDGATGLGGLSGFIAANIVAQALSEESGDLLERIKKGNQNLANEAITAFAEEKVQSITDIPKWQRSTCGLAAIQLIRRKNQGLIQMNFVAAADCIIFLQYENGQIRQVNHDYMDLLDGQGIQIGIEQWDSCLLPGENPNDWDNMKLQQYQKNIREKVQPLLKNNRNKLNTPGGYGIIDGSEEAPLFLETGSIPLLNVRKVLLLTDGLKLHSHRNGPLEEEWIASAKIAFTHGLNHLAESLIELEKADPGCYDYPRFKQHDDKTGILIEF